MIQVMKWQQCNQEDNVWMETKSGVEGWINIIGSNEISKGLESNRISRIRNQ